MKFKYLILTIFIFLACINLIECRRKKNTDESSRPSNIKPELYCNACQAMTREMLKKLKDSNSEIDVMNAIYDICNQRYYAIYDFPPPDMKKGCEAFINGNDEIIEREFIKRTNNDEIEQKLCYTITKACVGIDMDHISRFDDFIEIDGKKVPVGPDGQVMTNMPDDDLQIQQKK